MDVQYPIPPEKARVNRWTKYLTIGGIILSLGGIGTYLLKSEDESLDLKKTNVESVTRKGSVDSLERRLDPKKVGSRESNSRLIVEDGEPPTPLRLPASTKRYVDQPFGKKDGEIPPPLPTQKAKSPINKRTLSREDQAACWISPILPLLNQLGYDANHYCEQKKSFFRLEPTYWLSGVTSVQFKRPTEIQIGQELDGTVVYVFDSEINTLYRIGKEGIRTAKYLPQNYSKTRLEPTLEERLKGRVLFKRLADSVVVDNLDGTFTRYGLPSLSFKERVTGEKLSYVPSASCEEETWNWLRKALFMVFNYYDGNLHLKRTSQRSIMTEVITNNTPTNWKHGLSSRDKQVMDFQDVMYSIGDRRKSYDDINEKEVRYRGDPFPGEIVVPLPTSEKTHQIQICHQWQNLWTMERTEEEPSSGRIKITRTLNITTTQTYNRTKPFLDELLRNYFSAAVRELPNQSNYDGMRCIRQYFGIQSIRQKPTHYVLLNDAPSRISGEFNNLIPFDDSDQYLRPNTGRCALVPVLGFNDQERAVIFGFMCDNGDIEQHQRWSYDELKLLTQNKIEGDKISPTLIPIIAWDSFRDTMYFSQQGDTRVRSIKISTPTTLLQEKR
jgi:hypothetical protein